MTLAELTNRIREIVPAEYVHVTVEYIQDRSPHPSDDRSRFRAYICRKVTDDGVHLDASSAESLIERAAQYAATDEITTEPAADIGV